MVGLERRLREAARLGFTSAIVPRLSAGASLAPIEGLHVVHVATLRDAIECRADRPTACSWRGGPRDARLTARPGRSRPTAPSVPRESLIRYIRVLGAALGGAIGLVLATSGDGLFKGSDYAGALLAAWVVAWVVVGFAILPYLTVVPATWLVRRVEELSTAEFVASVLGLVIGLVMGLLLGFPLSNLSEPWGSWLPLGVSICSGSGCSASPSPSARTC